MYSGIDLNATQEILARFKMRFTEKIVPKHIERTKKLVDPSEFDINPFLAPYLSAFLTGKVDRVGIAKGLVLARALAASITTSFGSNMQNFISEDMAEVFGSLVPGIDIEFIDQLDGHKKFAQLKLGPNTINSSDVETINDHFKDIKNIGRQNRMNIGADQLVVGVLQGTSPQLNGHYCRLVSEYHYPIYVGQEFWHRLTGDEEFYQKLIQAIADSLQGVDGEALLSSVIDDLSKAPDIIALENLTSGE